MILSAVDLGQADIDAEIVHADLGLLAGHCCCLCYVIDLTHLGTLWRLGEVGLASVPRVLLNDLGAGDRRKVCI